MKFKCENCGKEHDGTYGSGRFCNTICSHSFSSKTNNEKRRSNISKTFKEKKYSFQHLSKEIRKSMTIKAHEVLKEKREWLYNHGKWEDLPLSYKKRKILEEQNGKCLICGLYSWRGKPLVLHLDHIDGNKKNYSRENLRYICPNCHSQTDTYCGNKQKLPQFEYLKTTKK